jgi:hypothetical protein
MKRSDPTENLEEFLDQINEHHTEDFIPVKATDELAKKLMKEEQETISTKKIKNISDIDLLGEYFYSKKLIDDKEKEEKIPPMKDIMSGKFYKKLHDTSDQDEVVFYGGNYLTRSAVEELAVYQNLNELGWNSLKVMKDKDVSKKITNILKNKDKKEKKKNKKHKKDDDFIIKIATDNDYDTFGDFQEDMLNFEAKNIFK